MKSKRILSRTKSMLSALLLRNCLIGGIWGFADSCGCGDETNLVISGISAGGSSCSVWWTAETNHSYAVNWTDSLTGEWPGTQLAVVSTGVYSQAIPPCCQRFFRVTGYTREFFDDFEDGDWNGWTSGSGSYTRQMWSPGAHLSQYALSLVGGSGQVRDGVQHSLPTNTPVFCVFWVCVNAVDSWRATLELTGPGNYGNTAVCFVIMDGQLRLWDGSTYHGVSCSANTWYKITLAFDWAGKRVAFFVNDELVKASVAFPNPAVTALSAIYLYNYFWANALWDEITLCQ